MNSPPWSGGRCFDTPTLSTISPRMVQTQPASWNASMNRVEPHRQTIVGRLVTTSGTTLKPDLVAHTLCSRTNRRTPRLIWTESLCATDIHRLDLNHDQVGVLGPVGRT